MERKRNFHYGKSGTLYTVFRKLKLEISQKIFGFIKSTTISFECIKVAAHLYK